MQSKFQRPEDVPRGWRAAATLGELPNLYPFLYSQQDKDQVRYMTGSRSKSCIQSYDRCFKRMQEFLVTKNADLRRLTPGLIVEYLMHVQETTPVYGYAQTIAGSCQFLEEAFDGYELWTGRVPRAHETLMRFCARLRPETKKAEIIPDGAIEAVMKDLVLPFVEDVQQINLVDIRALWFQSMQYSLFGRASEICQLRANDITRVVLAGVPAFKIRFRTSKTDPRFMGNYGYISLEEGNDCSCYRLMEIYYERCGFRFNGEGALDESFCLPRTMASGAGLNRKLRMDGRFQVSMTTLLKDCNRIYRQAGFSCRVTGKSAKSTGVSHAYRNGMSDDSIRLKGRWRSISTPQHYRHATDEALLNMSKGVSINSTLDVSASPAGMIGIQTSSGSSMITQKSVEIPPLLTEEEWEYRKMMETSGLRLMSLPQVMKETGKRALLMETGTGLAPPGVVAEALHGPASYPLGRACQVSSPMSVRNVTTMESSSVMEKTLANSLRSLELGSTMQTTSSSQPTTEICPRQPREVAHITQFTLDPTVTATLLDEEGTTVPNLRLESITETTFTMN